MVSHSNEKHLVTSKCLLLLPKNKLLPAVFKIIRNKVNGKKSIQYNIELLLLLPSTHEQAFLFYGVLEITITAAYRCGGKNPLYFKLGVPSH